MTAAKERLPDGWTWFTSVSSRDVSGRWYATAPYAHHVLESLREKFGKRAGDLSCTVAGDTWEELCVAATAQAELYESLTGEGSG
ncbi:hypothetical protein ACIQKE_12805 [Streptomyces griseoviridis]